MDTSLSLPSLPAPRLPAAVERLRAGSGTSSGSSFAASYADSFAAASAGATVIGPLDESRIDPAKRAQLRKSAEEFESQFISQMLSPMFETVEVDETFGGGQGEEMFRSFLTNEYAKQTQQRGGFGLADSVYRELLRAQEASHGQG